VLKAIAATGIPGRFWGGKVESAAGQGLPPAAALALCD
jgi:hypothetical protein